MNITAAWYNHFSNRHIKTITTGISLFNRSCPYQFNASTNFWLKPHVKPMLAPSVVLSTRKLHCYQYWSFSNNGHGNCKKTKSGISIAELLFVTDLSFLPLDLCSGGLESQELVKNSLLCNQSFKIQDSSQLWFMIVTTKFVCVTLPTTLKQLLLI